MQVMNIRVNNEFAGESMVSREKQVSRLFNKLNLTGRFAAAVSNHDFDFKFGKHDWEIGFADFLYIFILDF